MLVYFHIDEVARDSVVASALNRQIRAIGGQVIYGNRLSTVQLLRYCNCFDAIILPSLPHFVLAFPDSKCIPKNVFILQTEAVGQATGTLKGFTLNILALTTWSLSLGIKCMWISFMGTLTFKCFQGILSRVPSSCTRCWPSSIGIYLYAASCPQASRKKHYRLRLTI